LRPFDEQRDELTQDWLDEPERRDWAALAVAIRMER